MRAGMFTAALLATAATAQAQLSPNYRLEGALLAGSVSAPFVTCEGNTALGTRIGAARRLMAFVDLQATGSAVWKRECRPTGMFDVSSPLPGVYAGPAYDSDITEDPMLSADLRARAHSNGAISAEFAAGAGWGVVQNVPYGVIAGGLRFGRSVQIGVGGEVRSYRVPYDLRVTIIPETGRGQSSVHDGGHVWRRAEFLTLSASLPLGVRRTS